ncbi:hypothetical protein NA57DRAFT_79059 [Rhizodiscina lignyota]|uniref:Chromo domain-containing protein n=1 Tax=Rhizodiscina lignyota TaxID=1504668 RepID=A0A9P4IBE9_9PEZI|nr:hypothetical protein NA57DRAFT_79059 [Rhizodiscina lignyota]
MAPEQQKKRKQTITNSTSSRPRKKSKKDSSSSETSDSHEFKAKAILEEGSRGFLIDWAGIDPATGKAWKPTWEPKSHANAALKKEWRDRKKILQRKGNKAIADTSSPGPAPANRHPATEIASSPPLSVPDSGQIPETAITQSQPTPDLTPEASAIDTRDSSKVATKRPLLESPQERVQERQTLQAIVEVPPRIGFARGLSSWRSFSGFIAAQSSSGVARSSSEGAPASTGSTTAAKVVPDSQSLPGSSSYHPSTQSALQQSGELPSSSTNHQRSSSQIEDITPFAKETQLQAADTSDPIIDPSSPPVRPSTSASSESRISATAEKDFAETLRTDAGDIVPSIETSPPPKHDSQLSSFTRGERTVDQADISTEGEYSGPKVLGSPAHITGSNNTVLSNTQDTATRKFTLPPFTATFDKPPSRSPLHRRSMENSTTTPGESSETPIGVRLGQQLAAIRSGRGTTRRAGSKSFVSPPDGTTRSPSVIPDKLPQAARLEKPSSLSKVTDFSPKLVKPTGHVGHDKPSSDESEIQPETSDEAMTDSEEARPFPNLGPADHVIALAYRSSAIDAYRKCMHNHRDLFEQFCATLWKPNHPKLPKVLELIDRLENYANHPEVDYAETLTQYDSDPVALAERDEEQSTKFAFLGRFLVALSSTSFHVAIMSKPGRLVNALETYLKNRNIAYRRPDTGSTLHNPSITPMVTLLPSSGEDRGTVVAPADVIISFDNNLDLQSAKMKELREHVMNPGQLAPVVFLFVTNTIEHVERCIPSHYQGVERLQQILAKTAWLRADVGKMLRGYPAPDAAADKVAQYLIDKTSNPNVAWPIPQPQVINGFQPLSQLSQSDLSQSDGASDSPDNQGSKKRPFDMIATEPNKRARISEPPATSTAAEASLTHISDTVADPTQATTADNAMPQTEPHVSPHVSTEAPTHMQTEKQVNEDISDDPEDWKRKYLEAIGHMEDLQYRHEEQNMELVKTLKERDGHIKQIEMLQKKVEARDNTIATLKDERTELRKQLNAASEALQSSEIPEVAELERLRKSVEIVQAEKEKLQDKLKSNDQTLEYTRTAYQNASSAAANLGTENEDLKARIVTLERQDPDEQVKKQKAIMVDREKAWVEHTEKLELRSYDWETLATRMNAENRTLRETIQNTRGMGTRQGSTPRSPRLGPASRVGSPVPAGLGIGGRRNWRSNRVTNDRTQRTARRSLVVTSAEDVSNDSELSDAPEGLLSD